jgi:hypothetical protein
MTDRGKGANRSPTHLLHQAEQAAGRLFAENALGFVTLRQLVVLVAVSERDGLKQTELVERTGIDRSTLAEIIPRSCARASYSAGGAARTPGRRCSA